MTYEDPIEDAVAERLIVYGEQLRQESLGEAVESELPSLLDDASLANLRRCVQQLEQRWPVVTGSQLSMRSTGNVRGDDSRAMEETDKGPHAHSLLASELSFSLGPYELIEPLGQGGTATVYKARHTRLEKLVAIKLLFQGTQLSEETRSRVTSEIKVLGAIDHPNIVRALHADERNGLCYLVMEYVHGRNLQQMVEEQGCFSVSEACRITRQVAQALDYVHQLGLVHCDLKPSNLLITETGDVKLLDLGLARMRLREEADDHGALDAECVGTPNYMAPEQWIHPETVDHRVDLYALGCTIFFLLHGRAPYGTEPYATIGNKMLAHLEAPIPSLRHVRPDVPDGLDRLYHQLLAKRPEDRVPTARALCDALLPFCHVEQSPPLRLPSPREERRSRLSRKQRTAYLYIAALGFSLGLVVALLASRAMQLYVEENATANNEVAVFPVIAPWSNADNFTAGPVARPIETLPGAVYDFPKNKAEVLTLLEKEVVAQEAAWQALLKQATADSPPEAWEQAGRYAYPAAARRMLSRSGAGTSLDAKYTAILGGYFGSTVDRVRIHWDAPLLDHWGEAHFQVPLDPEANASQTYGYDIYIAGEETERNYVNNLKILALALAKVRQFEQAECSYAAFGQNYFNAYREGRFQQVHNRVEHEAEQACEVVLRRFWGGATGFTKALHVERVKGFDDGACAYIMKNKVPSEYARLEAVTHFDHAIAKLPALSKHDLCRAYDILQNAEMWLDGRAHEIQIGDHLAVAQTHDEAELLSEIREWAPKIRSRLGE